MVPLTRRGGAKQNFVQQIYLYKNSLIFNMIQLNVHEQTASEKHCTNY